MLQRFFFIFLFGSFLAQTNAQEFGGFPSSTKWKQINSDTARIIFPAAAKTEAQRVAAIIHSMAANANQLGNGLKKIDVVLHNRTTLANGYVALAPFRSEYYLIPGGNNFEFGNLPWTDLLAVHEYRHVQQYNNFNRGWSKASGIILGQEGQALANALAIPDWFFEGDAVYAETVLTEQGRGRMPYFLNGYNSLWKEGRSYNWMKLRNGSLKDYVPNHYQLGFLLVNYGYLKYGNDFWKKVTQDASAFKGLIYPFQKAIKQHAGVDYKTFRNEALKFYSHEVSRKRDDQKNRETVSNYYFPQVIGSDSLLYLKESYKAIPAFYIKDKNGEHKIKLRNISNEDWFSYRDGTIAYTAYNTSARWSLLNYSDIILLDIHTGAERKLTTKGKYFTPDIAPDGKRFIAVSVNDSVQSELHLLAKDGAIIKKITAPEGAFFIHPRFIDNGSIVTGIRRSDARLSLEKLDLQTLTFEQLIPPTTATLGFPTIDKGNVYFVSSFNGSDDIYRLQLNDKKVFQLTSGGTGNYFPSVNHDSLTWSAFTSNGFKVQSKALDQLTSNELKPAEYKKLLSPYQVANEKETLNVLNNEARSFPVEEYKKSTGLFNFHSWRPNYEDPEFSFSVYSDNVLNTFSNELFYRYNQNELSHAVGFNTAYAGLFPVINAGAEYVFDRQLKFPLRTLTLNQAEARIGYSIPLNFTGGKLLKFANMGSNIVYNAIYPTGITKDSFPSSNTLYLHHFINWSQQLPRARKQIYPKFGYGVSGSYRHRLDEKGYQSLAGATLFLPSISPTHSIVLTGSFQQVDTNNILFSNRFANSRGYEDLFYSRMWKASANYHFPLLYPDRGVGNIVYLLRVRSNIFYDYTKVFSRDKSSTMPLRSSGTELFFDTKWWNQLPVSFGFRYSYLHDGQRAGWNNQHRFEFILPVNLIPD